MTTSRVAISRVPSMPLNELAESAALPSGPAMYTDIPAGPARAMFRRLVAASEALFQPWEPRLTGTSVWIAFPSWETIGPATWASTTPATPLNRATSAAALALSALVSPDGRSYTTTAVKVLGDWIFDC